MTEQQNFPDEPDDNTGLLTSQMAYAVEKVREYFQDEIRELFVTNQYKVRFCLMKNLNNVSTRQKYIAPLGIFATIMITLITATFKPALGIDPDTWIYIFVFFGGFAFYWFLRAIIEDIKAKTIEETMEDIIEDLRSLQRVEI